MEDRQSGNDGGSAMNATAVPLSLPADNLLPSGTAMPPIDWRKVASHLKAHGHHLDVDFEPRRFAGGLANVNLLIRIDDGWAVFRRPPPGPIPKGAHDMAREHKVLSRLWRHCPLAPRGLHYCGDVEVAGAPFQIIEYQAGRVLRGDDPQQLGDDPALGGQLSDMLVDTLVQLHAVETEAAGLGDLGSPEGFMERTARGWIRRASAVLGAVPSPAGIKVAQWLEGRPAPASARPVLLHNDFKLDNIIIGQDAITPLKVIDWDMATRGDPMMDLAVLLSYWTQAGDPDCMCHLGQMPTARPGFLSREEVATAYAACTGLSLDGFIYARVLAIFRLAVVVLQLRALHDADPVKPQPMKGVEPDALFAFAGEVIDGKRF